MAADSSNCGCRCNLAHPAWAIPHRTYYRLFLAEADRAGNGKRDHREHKAIVLVSILFGYGHYYKGASGVIDSGVAGPILGTA